MALLLVPVMTVMWLCTTGCVKLMIPKLTTLTAMVIASLVTSTDPVLSQAIAKGPFADKYVSRALREIISAEAGSNEIGMLYVWYVRDVCDIRMGRFIKDSKKITKERL